MSWETVALGDVATLNPRDSRPGENVIISFVSMADLSAAAAQNTHETEKPFASVATGYTQFRSGDLLAAKITPCWENGKVGEATLTHQVGVGSTEFHVVRPNDRLDARYALHFLRDPLVRQLGELRMTGSGGQRRVPRQFLSNLRIPLPEMEEQRRIAGVLDAADAVRAKRREQLALLDELPQSLFHEMFDSSRSNLSPLNSLITIRSSLIKPNFETGGSSPHVGPDSLTSGSGTISGYRTIAEDGVTSGKYQFEVGDVLYSKIRPNLNKVATATFPGLCSADMYALVPNANISTASYIEHLLRSPAFLSYAISLSNRANIPKLNRAQLEAYKAPLPPMEEQEAFAEKVGAIRVERERVARALQADDELFAALQYRAFRGEL